MIIELNGEHMGKINTAQQMTFSFADLIEHASKTRTLSKGTLIGSGTVSSSVSMDGYGCLMERNAVLNDRPEIYLKHGDRVKIYIEGFEDTLIIDQIVQ
jgi:fumarylacetoacetate (FAA) hydrolase